MGDFYYSEPNQDWRPASIPITEAVSIAYSGDLVREPIIAHEPRAILLALKGWAPVLSRNNPYIYVNSQVAYSGLRLARRAKRIVLELTYISKPISSVACVLYFTGDVVNRNLLN